MKRQLMRLKQLLLAIIAINCSIPVVVGAENALNLLKDDMEVTVDTVSGIVYEGAINI